MSASPSSVQSSRDELDYRRYRDEVLDLLACSYPQFASEHEAMYQEAWAEFLELRSQGRADGDPRQLLRVIAWRDGRDRARRIEPSPLDLTEELPESSVVRSAPGADEEAVVRLDAEVARQIAARLEPRHAAIIKLRFELDLRPAEIEQRFGISKKRQGKLVTATYRELEALLARDESGLTGFQRRQRSLLLACLFGIASRRQIRQAQAMLKTDPTCRAQLRGLRDALEQVAALTPAPILVDRRNDRLAAFFDRLAGAWRSLRHWVSHVLSRGDVHVTSEQAAGATATVGAAGAAKVVIACLAVAGGTAACVTTLVHHPTNSPAAKTRRAPKKIAKKPPAPKPSAKGREPHITYVATPPPVTHHTTPTKHHHHTTTTTTEHLTVPPSETEHYSTPSPSAPGSTEFGPGNVGSSGASQKPAAAPQGSEFLP